MIPMVEREKKVSVVIPTYNRAGMLCDCVASVLASDYPDFDVIVVDDCSTDDTAARLIEKFGDDARVRYVRSEKNLRTAGARNLGACAAQGDWLLFLDNDNLVEPDCIRQLMHGFEIDSTLTLVGALSIQKYNGTIWTLGATFNFWTSRPQNFCERCPLSEIKIEDRLFPSWYAPNAFMVRRNDFIRCGGFDQSLQMMYEESDFGLRLTGRKSGAIYPMARTTHLGFVDHDNTPTLRRLGIGFPERAFYFARNRSVFVKRHFPFWGKVMTLVVFVPLFAVYYCVVALKNHRSDIAWAFFKGSIWGWFAPVRRRGLKLECLSMEKESTAVRTMGN